MKSLWSALSSKSKEEAAVEPVPTPSVEDAESNSNGNSNGNNNSGGNGPSGEDKERGFQIDEANKTTFITYMSKLSIGMELSRITAPAWLLEGISLLELLAHNFMGHPDLFTCIPDCKTPEERLVAVARWYISGLHCRVVKKKPYNPILGEEFEASWSGDYGNVHFSSEQVSHHPPMSAFYFECTEKKLVFSGYNWSKTKFWGTSIKVPQEGVCLLHDMNHNEQYYITQPTVVIGGILTGSLVWEFIGPGTITCAQTGQRVEFDFKGKPWFRGEYDVISGKIFFNPTATEPDATISGKWSKVTSIEYIADKKTEVLFDATTTPPIPKVVPPVEQQSEYNSLKVWGKLTEALNKQDWREAENHKYNIETGQRKIASERKAKKEIWTQRLFHLDEEDNWVFDCYLGSTKEDLKKGLHKESEDGERAAQTTTTVHRHRHHHHHHKHHHHRHREKLASSKDSESSSSVLNSPE